jgi:hypothetical protein
MTNRVAFKIPHDTRKGSLHDNIIEACKRRKKLSKDKMETRYATWKKDEESFIAYMPERDVDAARRASRESGKPEYTTIELPYAYATLMSAVSYWSTVFLSRDPVFQYAGRHGEADDQVKALEAVMDYQRLMGKMMVPLYVWLLDAGKYGVGILGVDWKEESEVVSRYENVQETFMGLPVEGKFKRKKVVDRIRGYEGNNLYNVKPQKFFPDPRQTLAKFQNGEFVIIETELSWNDVREREQAEEYFNIKQLEKERLSALRNQEGATKIEQPSEGQEDLLKMLDLKTFQIDECYIELRPKDWGLGNTEFPEKWAFTIANEKIVIGARPMGSYHNKFPFELIEYEIDGYALFNRSMMEVIRPLNNVISWLFNSHFYNVRKCLNDMFLVDPSKVVMKDMLDPAAGKLIRLKPSAYGTDLKSVAQQFQVTDVTQQHLRDVLVVIDFAQRVSGVSDNIMGVLDPRGRKTATEVRTAGGAGAGRQKTTTEYMSAMGFEPLGSQMAQNTQQYMSLERQFRIAGDQVRGQAHPFVEVNPEAIQGFFDFVPVDGTLPVDRFAQANLWRDLMREAMQSETLAGAYDWVDMFGWVAQLAGMKNINRFKINVRPDSVLEAEARAGNVVALGGGNAGGTGGSNIIPSVGGGSGNSEGSPRPTEIAGVGPVS